MNLMAALTLLSNIMKAENREKQGPALMVALVVLIVLTVIVAVGVGAVEISAAQVIHILTKQLGFGISEAYDDSLRENVVMQIRLPRVFLGLLVGSGLGIAGALMQGVFRNPLADPGLIGVSSGAALAASLYIVLGDQLAGLVGAWADMVATPVCAFFGALGVTYLVWRMGSIGNRVSVPRLLLAGIAINSLAGAVIGSLTLVATDSELRDLTFWSLGSLNGATWETVITAALGILPVMLFAPGLARSLDAWLLGEAEAGHLGVNVVRLKRVAVCTTALAVGAAVAVSGMIGFIGLVIPHLIRLTLGPGHRYLLPGSALLGALVLLGSDMLARTVIMPVEVPIGIVTALGGAPFFLLLLHKSRNTGLLG